MNIVILAVLFSSATGFLGGWLGAKSYNHQGGSITTAEVRQRVLDESTVISDIAETVGASVVSINVQSERRVTSFFGPSQPFTQESAGTGFIISKDGIVLTNRHVIPEGATNVSIVLSDGTELDDVEVLGRTNANDPLDIAFLKINDHKGNDLVPVKLGASSDAKVGQKVVAIGNALGQFQNSVTSGIISGYGRSITARDESGTDTLQNLFQTDAAINQGNSGGPLVNINGEVIGVNTAVAGDGAENIGFAIPIDDIKGLIAGVLEKGVFERPYLGVRYIQLNEDIAEELEIKQTTGAYIISGRSGQPALVEGGPADKAGLQEEDIILKVNDKDVDEDHTLVTLVGQSQVGDEIELTIIRDGNEQKIKVILEATPEN